MSTLTQKVSARAHHTCCSPRQRVVRCDWSLLSPNYQASCLNWRLINLEISARKRSVRLTNSVLSCRGMKSNMEETNDCY
jgi:hypothetical protein